MPLNLAELKAQLEAEFTSEEIATGELAMDRFRPRFTDKIQEVSVLARLLSEASAAAMAIDKKYMAISFFAGSGEIPGNPQGRVQVGVGRGLGFFQVYENGAIFWRRDLGAWWVHGAILDKYKQLGAEGGFLGYPLSDEMPTGDGIGRFNDFEGGSIYWHFSTGANEVHGDIRAKWKELGAEAFGYPATDESMCSGGGRLNHFHSPSRNGKPFDSSIFWTEASKAHAVYGPIRDRWSVLGWEKSYLGFPISDESDWVDPEGGGFGRITHFERGDIACFTVDNAIIELPHFIILRSGPIGVSSVGGSVSMTLSSAGTFHFNGHIHNSGVIGLACTLACVVGLSVPEVSALTLSREANLGGSLSFNDRDQTWDDSGYAEAIRLHWNKVREGASLVTAMNVGLGQGESLITALVFMVAVLGAGIIGLHVGGGAPEGQSCTTAGWHTGTDLNNHEYAEPSAVRCKNQ